MLKKGLTTMYLFCLNVCVCVQNTSLENIKQQVVLVTDKEKNTKCIGDNSKGISPQKTIAIPLFPNWGNS